MNKIIVRTPKEFEDALNSKASVIICEGEVAEKLKSNKKKKMALTIGGVALIVLGVILWIPSFGGSTALIATGLTIGSITVSTAELAIIFGGTIALKGINKGFSVKFNKDGSVEVFPKDK